MPSVVNVRELTGVWAYLRSIPWSKEPWLQGLLLFHGGCLLAVLLSRHRLHLQAAMFLFFLSIVFFTERLNEVGARHWKSFSTEQYFDSHGMFISLVLSFPLLVNCLVLVALWLWRAGNLVVDIKRKQLKIRVAKEKAESRGAADGAEKDENKKDN